MTMPNPAEPPQPAEPQKAAKKKPGKGARIFGAVVAGLIGLCCLGGVIGVVNSGGSGGGSGKPADRSMEAAAMCETFVKKQLKAPATAKFSDEATSKGAGADEYVTSGAVDAQNSFGALLRYQFACDLTVSGDTWTSKSVDLSQG